MSTTQPTGYAYGGDGGYPYATPYAQQPYPPSPPAPPAPRRRPRSPLGLATLSVALVSFGLLLALDATDAVTVPGVVLVAVPLLVVGTGLVLAALLGVRFGGLLAAGIVLLLMTSAAAQAPSVSTSWRTGTGDRTWTPTSAAVAARGYDLGAGDARLDLTRVPLDGSTLHVDAHVGAGSLIVTVPADTTVIVDAQVGLGQLRVPDATGRVAESDGFSLERAATLTPVGPSTGTLTVDLEVGVGNLEVRRAAA